ncbi:hypothetical protein [Hoylesella enoeca]|uniref:Uncharacterized protein n=1 Tax=Hoylesella enoeca TaxID=76123 RepID=A0A0S2KKV1_9BACT|nr:hypothetical protein [Hoylesella enoeca]ALO48923.1 hypothetical protein AS203_07395 [Hoylesella enoeca]
MNNAIVISDSPNLLELAKKYGLNTYLEVREEGQDELVSCYNFIKNTKHKAFILLPVTQPFRENGLIQQCCSLYRKTTNEIDFITSFTEIPNRERFYLNFEGDVPCFRKRYTHRMGEACTTIPMIDGAIYLIKTEFIKKVISSQNTNSTFWNGRFRCIRNGAPFIDVDTLTDMKGIEILRQYYLNVAEKTFKL